MTRDSDCPRLFVGNFDFEHQLAGVSRPRVREINRDLLATWLAVLEPGDGIAGWGATDREFRTELASLNRSLPSFEPASGQCEIVPWGWSSAPRLLADRSEQQGETPPDAVVRVVNSREFSHSLETSLGCGLDGQRRVTSEAEFVETVTQPPLGGMRWVAKAELSMSGRERLTGLGLPAEPQMNWVRNRLAEGRLYLEPWVSIRREVGTQIELARDGIARIHGRTETLTCGDRFAGCVIHADCDAIAGTEEPVHSAIKAAADAGYFGSLGIDSAEYELAGTKRSRALQDINGRFTMGRLALGWLNVLQAAEVAAWLFLPWGRTQAPREFVQEVRRRHEDRARIVRTSPFRLDDHVIGIGTLLVITSSLNELRETVRSILSSC